MNSKKHTAFVICGPTAVGKTGVSIQLAKQLNTEILSADSRQCYKEMSLGTAKPTVEEQHGIKHHFIDEYSIVEHITVATYEEQGLQTLSNIFQKNDNAVVCGGTGLYIKALCEGIDTMPSVNPEIKEAVNNTYEEKGIEWLQKAIEEEDPQFYAQGEVQNPVRMLRALSFVRSVGESITTYQKGIKQERPFNIIKVGLELPRDLLYERINQRVDMMMMQGLMAEAKVLYSQKHIKNLQTVGYQEIFDYMDGIYTTLEEGINKIKQHTRNYAKRQMTWFKKDKEIQWFRSDDKDLVSKIIALKK